MGRSRQLEERSYERRHEHSLESPQQSVPPWPQLASISSVEHRRRRDPRQVFGEPASSVRAPGRVVRRQLGNAESYANAAKVGIELLSSAGIEWAPKQLGGALRIVDEHVEHGAVRPKR